ncbi:site-specific integrase [Sphingopyxis sp. KK2]|uniref:tyrosine-type recombinase/integrase n=1 Tax=Sphingopyxis sp. KK2 TaxID=1855727 RepID=UPI00097E7307|nr:site-specific integrase [Sphingopyxis sp. KK2]
MAGINKLSATQLRGFPDGSYADGGNLYFRVRGNSRSWVFRFKVPLKASWSKPGQAGKPVEMGLGAFPARSLADARGVAEIARSDLANDRDPRERFKPEDPEADMPTFKVYAAEYIEANKGGWRNPKHRQQWPNTLAEYAYPTIGEKRPGDIKVGDVQKLLLPVWATKTETASRVRQRIETIIDYAFVIEGIDRRNPARWKGNLDKLLPNPRKIAKANGRLKSHAAPPWQEVPAIMAKLRAKPEVVSALALRFSILTAARSTEVRAGVWDEVDLEKAVWTIPGDRTKNEESHAVPLCGEAVDILTFMADRKHPDTDRIFPGAEGGLLSDVAINKQLHAAMPGVTAHGTARSSFRDWVAEATNYSDKVAEAALNHKNPNETEAAYLRTKFFDRRVELMKVWGEFLNGKDNVVGIELAKTGTAS